MTNSWQDIANATLVVVWGANPSENHPACMAHVNRARFPKQFFTGDRANKQPAKLVVIDPRKNRTALQADLFVRIRPGTDIAFGSGLMKYLIETLESPTSTYADGSAIPASIKTNYMSYLNQAGNGTFFKDGDTATSSIIAPVASVPANERGNCSKYTDARFIVNGSDTDYDRGRFATSGALSGTWVANPISGVTVSDFPKKSTDVNSGNTVYSRLKAHLAPYDLATVASICNCTVDEIKAVGDLFIQNSRHASTPEQKTFTRRFKCTPASATAPEGTQDAQPLWAYDVSIAKVDNITKGTTGIASASNWTLSAGPGSRYGYQTITRVANSTAIAANDVIEVTYTGYTDQAPQVPYRATTMLYAMGITQHTCGSSNVKTFANIQTIMGNMGRSGGGINALRGIHNVQGSTDMGVLYHLIPGYSANPGTQVDAIPSTNNAFGQYMDGLWGNTLNTGNGTGSDTPSYNRAYTTSAMGLQQRGFFNMTHRWFGVSSYAISGVTHDATVRKHTDAAYSLWPKTNGDNHIQMFRKMADGNITAAIVWGQNPAVTEPNQGKIRDGLKALDLLVVTDMFETETAGVSRKSDGITYLLPASSYVEKAGSATNSARALQWRYEATRPAGNSRDDLELLLRLAKQFDLAGAFSHISGVWSAQSMNTGFSSVYDVLYKAPYGGFDGLSSNADATNGYYGTAVSGSVEIATMRKVRDEVVATPYTSVTKAGSEWVAESIFREWAADLAAGGTLWLYTQSYMPTQTATTTGAGGNSPRLTGEYTAWGVGNRAKSRDSADPYGNMGFHKWGYSWLVNRRCLYNNSEVAGDQNDFFMGQDSCIRIFAPNPGALIGANGGSTLYTGVHNYSRWYRTHVAPTAHVLYDKPRTLTGGQPSKHAVYALAGRFPAHVEPSETPSSTLAAEWGFNSTTNSAIWDFGNGTNKSATMPNLVYGGTPVAGWNRTGDKPRGDYPLVLTTIRCVEHFQGGPITRNNWWNVEAEPEPWIEISSFDARLYNIKDGQMVKVVTARTEDLPGSKLQPYGEGFRARVGVGLAGNQRVGQGVVAIPWHWGDKGLSTGSRANDLCVDAMDANTTIPEYKACLCRIEPM